MKFRNVATADGWRNRIGTTTFPHIDVWMKTMRCKELLFPITHQDDGALRRIVHAGVLFSLQSIRLDITYINTGNTQHRSECGLIFLSAELTLLPSPSALAQKLRQSFPRCLWEINTFKFFHFVLSLSGRNFLTSLFS